MDFKFVILPMRNFHLGHSFCEHNPLGWSSIIMPAIIAGIVVLLMLFCNIDVYTNRSK